MLVLAVGSRDGCALAIEPRLLLRRRAILNDVLADAQDAQDVCEQAMKVRLNKCAVGLAHHCCHQRQDVDVQGSVGHDEGEGEVRRGVIPKKIRETASSAFKASLTSLSV